MTTRVAMTMLLASLLTVGGLHPAGAQPSAQVPIPDLAQPATRVEREYYGWQILLIDAASAIAGIGMGAGGGDGHPGAGMAVFAGGYLLGGPIVHLSHGKPGRAGTSLGLRAGLPALGAGFVLYVLYPEEECGAGDDFCGEDVWARGFGALAASVLGMGVASIIDWTVLGMSREEVPVENGPTLVPQVSAGADGSLQIGVLGRF